MEINKYVNVSKNETLLNVINELKKGIITKTRLDK